jgi:hypothetical protein
MTAHLNQGQSIAYYDASNAFLGGVDYAYPSNAGTLYICVSGRYNDLYQSLCALPGTDNAVVSGGGTSPEYCLVGLPMKQVDDGCYTVASVDADTTAAPSPSTTPRTSVILTFELLCLICNTFQPMICHR